MAAENTLLFGASAIRCSSQFHLQNPDLLKKWWMSWLCYCFSPLPHLFLYLSIFFHTIEDWSSVYVRLQGKFCPSFARCFKITLKSDAGFGQSPLALGFCAAVRVRSYDLWFADDMSNALLVAVEVVLQSKVSNVRNDVTGATHHITDRLTWVVKTQFSVFLMLLPVLLCCLLILINCYREYYHILYNKQYFTAILQKSEVNFWCCAICAQYCRWGPKAHIYSVACSLFQTK